MGHYEVDADTYANDWQVDYLKVDFCGPTSGGSMRALFIYYTKQNNAHAHSSNGVSSSHYLVTTKGMAS
jgi:hypothetical protein